MFSKSELSISKNSENSTKSSKGIIDIPNVVLREILKNLDFRSILLLRKTCHSLRDSIDFIKPDLKFTTIEFQLTSANVFIELFYSGEKYRKCVPIWYLRRENGCEVSCNSRKKFFENTDFLDLALKDYELLLTYQSTTLDWFGVNLEYFQSDPLADAIILEPIAQKVLETTKNILARRDRPLKVERFRMTGIREDQVLEILPLVDTKPLKFVSIHGKRLNPMLKMRCEKLEELDQWKQAERVEIWRFDFKSPIEKLMKFEEVEVFFQTVLIEDIMKVKEIFLHSKKLQTISIKYETFTGEDQLIPILGNCEDTVNEYAEKKRKWIFKHSNPTDAVSIVHLLYFIQRPGYIEFTRNKVEDLSESDLKLLKI